MRQFCNWQDTCLETPEGMWDCFAHLAEARVFLCPYTEADIILTDRYDTGKMELTIPTGHPGGVCVDFEPLECLKDELRRNCTKIEEANDES